MFVPLLVGPAFCLIEKGVKEKARPIARPGPCPLQGGKIQWGGFGLNWLGFTRKEEDEAFRKAARNRHGGRLNVVYCDGHAESMKVEKLLLDYSDRALRRWNNDNEPHRIYELTVP